MYLYTNILFIYLFMDLFIYLCVHLFQCRHQSIKVSLTSQT